MGILEMTADLYDLFIALDAQTDSIEPQPISGPDPGAESRAPTPKDQHVQGRSRRRMNRDRQTRRHSTQSDGSSSENEDHQDNAAFNANKTLRSEISFVELSLDQRLERLGLELDDKVRSVQEGLELLSMEEGDEQEVWTMLSFALQDWR